MPSCDDFTGEVKDVALRAGAALVGVANVERFSPTPPSGDRGISCRGRGPS